MANQLAPRMERRGGGGVNRLLGIIEPAMTVGSAIAAEVPALAVGLGSLNTVEDRLKPFSEAVSAADEVREMLTYNPRSMEGQAGMQSLINSVSQLADTVGLDTAFQVLNKEIIPRVQSTLGEDAARELGSMAMMIPAVRRLSKEVFHGGFMDGDQDTFFVATDRAQAQAYAQENKAPVHSFNIDLREIATDDTAMESIARLGIEPLDKNWRSSESSIYELLDPNFEQYIGKANVKKLKEDLRQQGYKGISFLDFDALTFVDVPGAPSGSGRQTAQNIALFEKPSAERRLPMDTASRMQRAKEMEFEKDVYHGTYSDFSEFDPQNDLGVHVGTPEQAYNRLLDLERHKIFNNSGTRGGITVGEGGQIMPLKAKLKKSLNMKDVGDWKNPYEVLVGLRATPIGKKYEKQLNEIEDEMIPEMESFRYGEENWTDSREASEYTDELRNIIRNEGYDSVKYLNEVENQYGSQSGLTPKGKKQKEKLQKEVKKINDEIGKRDQELVPKLGASAEEIEKFLETNPTTRTVEENKKIENLKLQIKEVEENKTYDPHSYIILDPEQLRSINAEFDPEKKDSSNILSSILDQRFRNIA